MTGLNRALAPMSEAVWRRVEKEAREVLELHQAARRVVDFEGPLGWDHSALDLGRVERLPTEAAPTVMIRERLVRPLIELRVRFALDREQLEGIDRGAASVDLEPLRGAARQFAAAEDSALFDGYAPAGIPGLMSAASDQGVTLDDPARLPEAVSQALDQLRRATVASCRVLRRPCRCGSPSEPLRLGDREPRRPRRQPPAPPGPRKPPVKEPPGEPPPPRGDPDPTKPPLEEPPRPEPPDRRTAVGSSGEAIAPCRSSRPHAARSGGGGGSSRGAGRPGA